MTAALADEFVEIGGIPYSLSSRAYEYQDGAYQATVERKGYPSMASGNEYSGSVEIPRGFTYGGRDYVVTSLGYQAFYNQSGLTELKLPSTIQKIETLAVAATGLTSFTIPESVISIGLQAFFRSDGLTELKCQNPYPPQLVVNALQGFDVSKCSLYVPRGAVDRYREATGWSSFASIEEDPDSPVPPTEVMVTPLSLDAFVGSTLQLTATVLPEDATDKTVVWKSLSPDNASVDENGLVTFHNDGICTIEVICNGDNRVSTLGNYFAIDEFQEIGGLRYQVSLVDHAAQVVGFQEGCERDELFVPESYLNVRNWRVTGIGPRAFAGTALEIVHLSPNIVTISEGAFVGCDMLVAVDMSDNVSYIGSGAFEGDSRLGYLRCMARKPPVIQGDDVFDTEALDNCMLVVASECQDKYADDTRWRLFANHFGWSSGDMMPTSLDISDGALEGAAGTEMIVTPVLVPASATFKDMVMYADDPSLVAIDKKCDSGGNVSFRLSLLKEGVTTLRAYCGMVPAVCGLTIGPEASLDVISVAADSDAIRYFNLQGSEIRNPDTGSLVIVSRGGRVGIEIFR